MTRFALPLLLFVSLAVPAAARPQAAPATDAAAIPSNIISLGSLDYPVRTRAARLLRRAPENEVVPALVAAVRDAHTDEYVRFRAFVLLTSFNAAATPELARVVLRDRNDRLRETAYKWLEQHPDPQLTPTLLAALQTEQAEFVRPALEGALAALGSDPEVQRALVAEAGRGLDVFRSAVIDALGRHHATYAVDALAAVAREEGPLQGDAILALGRIGGDAARAVLAQLMPRGEAAVTLQAAQCLVAAETCPAQIDALKATAAGAFVRASVAQAAVGGLGTLAEAGHGDATKAIVELSMTPALHDATAFVFGAVALRAPDRMLAWLGGVAAPVYPQAVDLLKDGFESLEEDYAKEQFFAAARAAYWKAPENSPARTSAASIIERLEF